MKSFKIVILILLLSGCGGSSMMNKDINNNYSYLVSNYELSKSQNDSLQEAITMSNSQLLALETNLMSYQNANEELTTENQALASRLNEIESRTPVKPDTVVVNNTTSVVVNRTSTEVVLPDANNGKIALYCPPVMNYKESSDVFGFISELISDEQVREKMIARIREEGIELPSNATSNNNLLIRTIQFYSIIELRLDDADNEGFVIKKVHETDKQEVKQNMEGWRWVVTPSSSEPKQKLIFKAIIYKQNGEVESAFTRTYQITVKVKPRRFLHSVKMLFVENTQWAIGSMIIPLIAFFWGRYQERKKNKKPKP